MSFKNRLFHILSLILVFSAVQILPVLSDTNRREQVRFEGGYEVEQEVELGHGFRAVTLLVPTYSGFAHFGFLYYRAQRVSRAGALAIAPSGEYAIFQVPTGNLMLYRRIDGRKAKLTSHFIDVVESFEWHSDSKRVEVHYRSKRPVSYSVGSNSHWSWFF